MHRAKKTKGNSSKNAPGNTVYSGSFMTSYLHDEDDDEQTEFNNEMPIASPDTLNNEVIADTNEEEPEAQNETKSNNMSSSLISANNSESEILHEKSSTHPHKYQKLKKQVSSGINRKGRGGLTLTGPNNLKNLIMYIKSAYSSNLTSPKWKNFKGLKLGVIEKIRLNNVIWRTWFEQYGTKNSTAMKKPSLLLSIQVDDAPVSVNPKMAVIEGEYWKRRLSSITNEYKKWRTISRQHVKQETEELKQIQQLSKSAPTKTNLLNLANNSNNSTTNNQANLSNNMNAFNQYQTNQLNNIINTGTNVTNYSSAANGNDFINNNTNNSNNYYHVNVGSQFENTSYLSNHNNTSNQANSYLYDNNQSLNSSVNISDNNSLNAAFISNNHAVDVSNGYVHPPISNKQVPFTNRCRSPSPGLFQDIDMFNFSSDTLFGTNYLQDQKTDPIFGNNPDLFQPDLMHLYPNFDFFDLDYNDSGVNSSNSHSNHSNSSNLNSFQNTPVSTEVVVPNQLPVTPSQSSNKSNSPNEYLQRSSSNYQLYNNNDSSKNGLKPNDNKLQSPLLHADHQQQQPYSLINQHHTVIDSSDLYNFNTLVSAAVAMPNIAQNNGMDNANHIDNQPRSQNLVQNQNKNNVKGGKKIMNSSKLKQHNHQQQQTQQHQTNGSFNTELPQRSVYSNNQQQQPQLQLSPNNSLNHSNNELQQQMSMNGSSNTIRNLLAQQPSHFESHIQIPNNIRPSGVYSISGNQSHLFQHQQNKQNPNIYSTSPNLIPNIQINGNNKVMDTTNPSNKNTQQISSLLSAVLAPSLEKQITDIHVNNSINKAPTVSSPTKPKRGRKTSTKLSDMNNNQDDSDTEPMLKKNSRNYATKIEDLDSRISSNSKSNHRNHKVFKSTSDYMNDYLTQQHQHTDKMNVSKHNSNYPSDTYQSGSMFNSAANSIKSTSESNDATPLSRNNSYSKLPTFDDANTPMSRSPSGSINNMTILSDQGISTAEQKRRCNIQYGFDRLQTLVPSLKDAKNSKASKATMLKKTSDYIKELKLARDQRCNDIAAYHREIEELSNKVTECQIQLPASGVSITGQLNKSEIFEKKFRTYVQEKTVENWKFYLFSLILKPLFSNFIQTLNTSSKEDTERTFYEWQEKHCNLVQLRPIVSTYLRQISKSTSILSDASKVPEECYIAALTKT